MKTTTAVLMFCVFGLCAASAAAQTMSLTTTPFGATTNRMKTNPDQFGAITVSVDPGSSGWTALSAVRVRFSGTAANSAFMPDVKLLDPNNIDVVASGAATATPSAPCDGTNACEITWVFSSPYFYQVPPGDNYTFTLLLNDGDLTVATGGSSVTLKAVVPYYSYYNSVTGGSGTISVSPPDLVNSVVFAPNQ